MIIAILRIRIWSCKKEYIGTTLGKVLMKGGNGNDWKEAAMSILEEELPNQRETSIQSPCGKREQLGCLRNKNI